MKSSSSGKCGDEMAAAKAKLETEYRKYVDEHPEMQSLVSDFMSQIIINQPKDIISFGAQYFNKLSVTSSQSSSSLVVLCGPSGVGKGTLLKKLFEEFPDKMGLSISHTTREPREGEVHGKHYFFISKDEFKKYMFEEDYFIEHAEVHDNFYGTSVDGIKEITEKQGKVCVLEIDVQGARKVLKSQKIEATPRIIYIAPPSMEELEKRLRSRGTESEEKITVRMCNAKEEMDWLEEDGNCDKKIINDDFEIALKELKNTLTTWYPQLTDGEK